MIVLDGDTSFVIPYWRLKEANKIFVTFDFQKEMIISLESQIKNWEIKSRLQELQIKDIDKVVLLKDLEIEVLNSKLKLSKQQLLLNADEVNYYKKQSRVLKVALGASLLGVVGITVLAIVN